MGKNSNIEKGDEVAWTWGGGAPGGTATEVKEDEAVVMETKNGNEVSKKGEPGNPAVYIERDGHNVVKKAQELHIRKKASNKNQNTKQSAKDKSSQNSARKNGAKVQKRSSKKGTSSNAQPRRSGRLRAKAE